MDPGDAVTAAALSDAEAALHLSALKGRALLLAVSGGVDSIALMGLVAEYSASMPLLARVAVVDHGLRDGSAAEAIFVTEQAARFGLSCTVLTWAGEKPKSGLQEAAREVRYRLLVEHAVQVGADGLVTGHTLDDQAETVMMRLAAGSGAAGLAGMKPMTSTRGLAHFRPFLAVSKERLTATCRDRRWSWIEDPSNQNDNYTRVRWRRLMPLLSREGLTAERLQLFARRMAEVEEALQDAAETALRSADFLSRADGWQVDARALFSHPPSVTVRALEIALARRQSKGRGPEAPQLARIEACAAAMREAVDSREALRRTLGGYVVSLSRDGMLCATTEPERRRGCVNRVRKAGLGNATPEN